MSATPPRFIVNVVLLALIVMLTAGMPMIAGRALLQGECLPVCMPSRITAPLLLQTLSGLYTSHTESIIWKFISCTTGTACVTAPQGSCACTTQGFVCA